MESKSDGMSSQIEPIMREIINILTTYGMDVLGAVAILVIGLWLSGRIANLVVRALNKSKHIDETLTKFFASFAKYIVMMVTVVAVLNQFGVQTASLLTVIGAAGLAIGLALQGTLSNVAAGVMLLIFRPFKTGDFIEAAGHAGSIKELNLFFTVMATGDNIRIVIPNSQIWGGAVSNYSSNDTRRVQITAGISYDDDIDKALAVLKETAAKDSRVHSDPEPFVAVSEMADSSVNLILRVWVANGDYWPVTFDLTKGVKQALDTNGISIPFPTRTIHMENSD